MGRLQEDWRIFGRLMRKARARLRETPGARNKLKQAAWIAQKAQEKIARRLKRARLQPESQIVHARQSALAAQRAALSALLSEGSLPACAAAGGGTIALSVEGAAVPNVQLRDGSSNLYGVTILDRQTLVSGPEGRLVTRLLAQAPTELLDGTGAAFDVVLRTPSEQVVFGNVHLQTSSPISIWDFRFENSCVMFSGARNVGDSSALSRWVSSSTANSAPHASVPGRRDLPRQRDDSGPRDRAKHLLELRETAAMNVLATLYQILPLHITPWQALQTYARPPLDGSLSKQARHHFHSYRLWFDRLRASGPEGVPPLDMLYGEIQQGFRKRLAYPHFFFFVRYAVNPTVSVIIPVHNKFEVTYYCLCSLRFAFNETSFEVIVVDDGSSDETSRIRECVDGIKVVRRTSAQGFVQACNEGAASARGEFLVLLNNDTEVTARWLDELVSVFRNFDGIGLAGSKLVYPDGRLQEAGGVIWGSGNPWNVGRYGNPDDPRYNYLRKADYVSGAALMIPRELWNEVGGFSPEFAPAYFEDTDLAMKVRARGRFVVYVPTSAVYHFEGQSAGTDVAAGMKAAISRR